MPLMHQFMEIIVEEGLLPQVVGELVALAEDQNHVEVTYGVAGRVIMVHPGLAEKWYQQKVAEGKTEGQDQRDVPIPVPVPTAEAPTPRNVAVVPSASNGEESTNG